MYMGVENYGGRKRTKEILMPLAPDFLEAQFGAGHWTLGALRFTTGPRNSFAEVFAGAKTSGVMPGGFWSR